MPSEEVARALGSALGASRLRRQAPLAPLTTFRAGGPAEWLFEARGSADLLRGIEVACELGVSVTVLGGGSNVLVSDRGVSGLVVRVHGGTIEAVRPDVVRAESGVTVNGLVRWTITRGLAGLERWAGTPGTVGGAVYGNAHFEGELIGDRVRTVGLVTRDGARREIARAEMEFGYDCSRLQRTGEILLWADFTIAQGNPASLRAWARSSLALRKRTQPLASASAGCVFRNPTSAQVPPGMPASAGALIDAAGLKDRAIGRARVSTTHGNFIVNDGGASASEIRSLVSLCRRVVAERFGVELRDEIVYLGEF